MSSHLGVVLDTGSRITKAGFAGEAFPRAVMPTVTARYVKPAYLLNSRINNWDEIEMLWHHIFYSELHVPPEDIKVMHSVHPLTSKKDKERMAEIMFESFTVEGIYIMKSPVLVLHASGRTSGVVWEGGATCSSVAAVYEGFPLKHTTLLSPLTGELLTDRLKALLGEVGYSFTTPIERDILDIIKAKHCYVPKDYEQELLSYECSGEMKSSHKLPDGQTILLGKERIQCPEVLFQPSIAGMDCPNIIDTISSCIGKCDIDHRSTFYDNIVLAGGTSMIPGLVDRVKAEVIQSVIKKNKPYKVTVEAIPTRNYAAWLGGSIMASLDILKGFWLTRQEYEDGGSNRVRYKCF